MASRVSSSVPWFGIVLCYCHMLCTAEADQRYSASSNSILESLHNESHLVYNASSTSKAALLSIFAKYGQNGTLNFEGFEHLLENLGLGNIAILDHNISEHHRVRGSWSVELHADHQHSEARLHHDHHEEDHKSVVDDNEAHKQHDNSEAHEHHTVNRDRLSAKVKYRFSFTMAINSECVLSAVALKK